MIHAYFIICFEYLCILGMWFLISRGWLKDRSLYINRTSKKAQSSIMLYFCSDTTDALRCLYFHDKGLAIKKAEMLNMMLSSWIKHSDITLNIKCLKKISFFKKNFWSIVDLQHCVSFRCAAKWISSMYTHSFLDSVPIWVTGACLPMQEMLEMQVWSLDQEDPLEEGVATHSIILAWRIPWTEEPGGLQSIRSVRAIHNWNDLTCTQEEWVSLSCFRC